MSKRIMRILVLLLCAVLLLSGCGQEVQTGAAGCEHWTSWPQLNYGTLEYEKLTVLPWNCGRREATSGNRVAETENGYTISFILSFYTTQTKVT